MYQTKDKSSSKTRVRSLKGRIPSQKGDVFCRLRKSLGFSQEQMARITGLSIRTISSLENDNKNPTKDDNRRYQELRNLYKEISMLIKSDAIGDWLLTPNEALGNFSPIELIERGEVDRVWRLVWRLQEGIPLD